MPSWGGKARNGSGGAPAAADSPRLRSDRILCVRPCSGYAAGEEVTIAAEARSATTRAAPTRPSSRPTIPGRAEATGSTARTANP